MGKQGIKCQGKHWRGDGDILSKERWVSARGIDPTLRDDLIIVQTLGKNT